MRTRTFTLTNEMYNIKQFVNEHSCQFDSHVKIYDKFRKKHKQTWLQRWIGERISCWTVYIFFSWNFLWSPITCTLLHYTHLLSRSLAHTNQCHADQMCVCVCVFSVQNDCFVHQIKKKITIKESLWKFTEIYGDKKKSKIVLHEHERKLELYCSHFRSIWMKKRMTFFFIFLNFAPYKVSTLILGERKI